MARLKNSVIYHLLGSYGFTGTFNDRLFKYLGSLGFTGTLSDRLYKYLGSLGLTGSMNDRLKKWDGAFPSAWDPSDLFKNGEQGWLMDLSLESLFQDAAGTIPVTEPGQPVGRVVDQSGRGNHWTQPTALNRPIYQVDAEGNPYLSFNGTNQWMQTAAFDWGSDEVTQVVGIDRKASMAGMAFEFSLTINANPGSFYLTAPETSGGSFGTAARGTVAFSGAIRAMTAAAGLPDVSVTSVQHSISGSRSDIWKNGVAGTPATGNKGTGNFGNYPLFIGMRGGTSVPFTGNIYPSLGINRLLSEAELASAEAWVAKRTGGLTA